MYDIFSTNLTPNRYYVGRNRYVSQSVWWQYLDN